LLHGEAVAIGLALDATYAREVGILSAANWQRIVHLLTQVGLPSWTSELDEHLDDDTHPRCVLRGLTEFREHLGGRLTIMLPRDIGHGVEVHAMDVETIRHCVDTLRPSARGAYHPYTWTTTPVAPVR
jgi:3-dehydroquinate synthase